MIELNDTERAIVDIGKVISHSPRNCSGAVPMPIRTLQESYDALVFEQSVFNIVREFAKNRQEAEQRIESTHYTCPNINSDMTVHDALDILKLALSRYFDSSVV